MDAELTSSLADDPSKHLWNKDLSWGTAPTAPHLGNLDCIPDRAHPICDFNHNTVAQARRLPVETERYDLQTQVLPRNCIGPLCGASGKLGCWVSECGSKLYQRISCFGIVKPALP